ncbi:SDR family NAD(P)-dependent oxidoreductase [Pseudonocardia sp. DLS-67]
MARLQGKVALVTGAARGQGRAHAREGADVVDVNLTGVWRSMKAVVPHMIQRRSGSIVLTSSVNGFEGNPGAAHYAAIKHAVLGLMRSAALELGPRGVRVNAACPGLIDTPMTNWPGIYDKRLLPRPDRARFPGLISACGSPAAPVRLRDRTRRSWSPRDG